MQLCREGLERAGGRFDVYWPYGGDSEEGLTGSGGQVQVILSQSGLQL